MSYQTDITYTAQNKTGRFLIIICVPNFLSYANFAKWYTAIAT